MYETGPGPVVQAVLHLKTGSIGTQENYTVDNFVIWNLYNFSSLIYLGVADNKLQMKLKPPPPSIFILFVNPLWNVSNLLIK